MRQIKDAFTGKVLNAPMKKWTYQIPVPIVYGSLDCGEVEGRDYNEARTAMIKKVTADLKAINDALRPIGHSFDLNYKWEDETEILEVKGQKTEGFALVKMTSEEGHKIHNNSVKIYDTKQEALDASRSVELYVAYAKKEGNIWEFYMYFNEAKGIRLEIFPIFTYDISTDTYTY